MLGVMSVIVTEYKAEARVLAFVFVQAVIGLIFYTINFAIEKCFYSKIYWEYALGFNHPLIPHYLFQTMLNQADRNMISNMVGNGEAAYTTLFVIFY